MADKENKHEGSVDGKYYVDTECIDCDVCRQVAPDFFKRNDDEGYSFVYAQPKTEDGAAECEEALESCPVEAIGNDGDS